MKSKYLTSKDALRKNHNNRILQALKSGSSLNGFSASASWFPPRPIITKNEDAVKKLYGALPKKKLGASKNLFNKSKGSSLFLV